MNYNVNIIKKTTPILLFGLLLCTQITYGQEERTDFSVNSPFHNQLFFNRYLINPTFSLVREDKSYLNILHRNQYAAFDDNMQNYYLGFSHKLNENTAVGIGVHGQYTGVIQEFGFNANYATSVQLGDNSKLTFGTNVTYLSEGVNKNSVVVTESDPLIKESRKENKISVQPGIALSLGRFDFGLYATNLVKYNQTTNQLITSFNDKSVKASLQYTHTLMARSGLFADARIMPLLQVGKNEDGRLAYIGSLLFDLPDHGWLQTSFDETYGLSLGLGFNLSKKLSLGYLMEKDVTQSGANLGWNHEVSLAYTFKETVPQSGDYVNNSADKRVDDVVRNYEEQILQLRAEKERAENDRAERNRTEKNKTEKGRAVEGQIDEAQYSLAYENRLILDELILRQDSIEAARNEMFEKRFETIVRLLKYDVKENGKSDLEEANSGPNRKAVASTEINTSKTTMIKESKELKEDGKAGLAKETSHPYNTAVVKTEVNTARSATIEKGRDLEDGTADLLKMNSSPNKLAVVTTASDNSRSTFTKEPFEGQEISTRYIAKVNSSPYKPVASIIQGNSWNTLATEEHYYLSENNLRNPAEVSNVSYGSEAAIAEDKKLNGTFIKERKEYIELPIKAQNRSDIIGVESGYYLIANVYKNKRYLDAFVNNLTEQGLDARQFYNKENGLYYVYLADFKMKHDAKTAVVSNLNGKYRDEKWIMQVYNNTATADIVFED